MARNADFVYGCIQPAKAVRLFTKSSACVVIVGFYFSIVSLRRALLYLEIWIFQQLVQFTHKSKAKCTQ